MTYRTASCSCGQLRAHGTADPIRISVCHCLACQRRTGNVYSTQARFTATYVTITGASKQFIRAGDGAVYEERIHRWVSMPAGIEHIA